MTNRSTPRFQQTRFQLRVTEASDRLVRWAANPWRRLSLLLIVLLLGFVVGGGIGSISGALAFIDQITALICVVAIEAAARGRGPLLRRHGDRLGVQLLDCARIGVLYGLLLDGFKVVL